MKINTALVQRAGQGARGQGSGHSAEMPFKHNAAHRHRIPHARYRVTNWSAHEAGLQQRGDPTFWFDKAALGQLDGPKL